MKVIGIFLILSSYLRLSLSVAYPRSLDTIIAADKDTVSWKTNELSER